MKSRNRWLRAACACAMLAAAALAQDTLPPPPPLPGAPPMEEETAQNPISPCLEPPPVIRMEDYHGPLPKVVGAFARKLERRAVHAPHYKPGAMLCSLEPKDKLRLFVIDTFDPISLLSVGFNSSLSQAQDSDPSFGQGMAGFGKRLGANFASQTSIRFFSEFAYPTIFSEDPRYYRLAHGKFSTRLLHAMEHSVVAHRDSGRHMFNFSEWLGTATGAAISNAYHPGNERGFGPAARGASISILTDMGFDVLREFWPEVARKFHMPFREVSESAAPPAH